MPTPRAPGSMAGNPASRRSPNRVPASSLEHAPGCSESDGGVTDSSTRWSCLPPREHAHSSVISNTSPRHLQHARTPTSPPPASPLGLSGVARAANATGPTRALEGSGAARRASALAVPRGVASLQSPAPPARSPASRIERAPGKSERPASPDLPVLPYRTPPPDMSIFTASRVLRRYSDPSLNAGLDQHLPSRTSARASSR